MKNQKGFTAWFTGLPCCGKTTVADKVAEILKSKGYKVAPSEEGGYTLVVRELPDN